MGETGGPCGQGGRSGEMRQLAWAEPEGKGLGTKWGRAFQAAATDSQQDGCFITPALGTRLHFLHSPAHLTHLLWIFMNRCAHSPQEEGAGRMQGHSWAVRSHGKGQARASLEPELLCVKWKASV